jgi:hypothetical protein
MARLPQASFSTASLITLSRRACRLCEQNGNGAQRYVPHIVEIRAELEARRHVAEMKNLERIMALDASNLAEKTLDNAVRTAYNECLELEWGIISVSIVEKAFPGGMITPIIRASKEKKPVIATKVVASLQAMALECGPLAGIAAKLDVSLQSAIQARDDYEQKAYESDTAWALEKLARMEFVHKYDAVYHTACGDLGRRFADKLFPVIRERSKGTAGETKENEPRLQAAA